MSHGKHKVCINAIKVYDWVTRQVEVPLITKNGDDLDDLFECKNKGFTPPEDLCEFLDQFPNYEVDCEIDPKSLRCREIKQPKGRQQVDVPLPSGETITLEKVKILVKGVIKVFILDNNDVICRSEEIPFSTAQTFFLCAPEGTRIVCKVTYDQCDADISCCEDYQQLDVSILLCLDVQAETDVKLEVEAAICKPRQELAAVDVVCPVDFPPQCPEIFPAKKKC